MKTKICLFFYCVLYAITALADTVYLQDEREIKGIIVEEYKDRVVISTYEGEQAILKKDIQKVLYDLVEQNLVNLGDECMSRGEYEKAYFYYEKAYKLNPEYKAAREKMNYVTGYLFRKSEEEKIRHVERRGELEKWPAALSEAGEDSDKKLSDCIGIQIAEEENRIKIKKIVRNSPAFVAGLKENDVLISVWGRLAGYMSKEEVASFLLEESLGEIKMGIERDITLKKENLPKRYQDIIGGRLDMLMDGLTLVDIKSASPGQNAGLSRDDLIVAINGTSTRYMPLDDAIRVIEDRNTDAITFTVKRDVAIWRK